MSYLISSLSKCNENDLERVQKSALKVILKNKYSDYKNALKNLNIESLCERRELLCLKFARELQKNVSNSSVKSFNGQKSFK